VERLKPLFLRGPRAFRPLMKNLVVDYLRACETAGTEKDLALLSDILPQLTDDKAESAET
jgi:hypothetical protein